MILYTVDLMTNVLDNASWHVDDAQTYQRAATHIALYYVWLINNNYMDPALVAEHSFTIPLSTDHTPGYYLEKYTDYKLVADDFTHDGQKRYANQKRYTAYLLDAGSDIVGYTRNETIEPQYNVLDTWDNVKVLDEYFNTMAFILVPRRWIAKMSQRLDAIETRQDK